MEDLKKEETELRKNFDELNPQNSLVKVYRDVHRVFEEVAKAFKNAKKENLRRFLAALEECANGYLVKLSAQDFHGEIRLCQTIEDSTEIKLFSSNGTEIKNPSGSQETVMYMILQIRSVMRIILLSLMRQLLHLVTQRRKDSIT